eukprot:scaffold547_cov384-Prasinococcus_capsulatus_cf.AAC.41
MQQQQRMACSSERHAAASGTQQRVARSSEWHAATAAAAAAIGVRPRQLGAGDGDGRSRPLRRAGEGGGGCADAHDGPRPPSRTSHVCGRAQGAAGVARGPAARRCACARRHDLTPGDAGALWTTGAARGVQSVHAVPPKVRACPALAQGAVTAVCRTHAMLRREGRTWSSLLRRSWLERTWTHIHIRP